jgi:hypothetical protein
MANRSATGSIERRPGYDKRKRTWQQREEKQWAAKSSDVTVTYPDGTTGTIRNTAKQTRRDAKTTDATKQRAPKQRRGKKWRKQHQQNR